MNVVPISTDDINCAETSEDHKLVLLANRHEQILKESLMRSMTMTKVAFLLSFVHFLRSSIIVLYLKKFDDNDAKIGVVILSSYIVDGIVSLLFGIIGDKWRFDNLLIIAGFLDVVTFCMSCVLTA